jgi:chemotaxis protein MotA
VGVLKDIANPKSVGPAMAISITTAFYGILVSALFCTPIAGKIRSKAQEATRVRRMILTGILDIVAGAIPVEVEQRLQPFIQKK